MIIFLYGEDDFRAKQKIKEMKNKFVREVDPSGSALSVLDGKDVTLKEINDKIGAASLLAKKRMLVLEDIFSSRKKDVLEEALDYFKEKEKKGNEDIIVIYQGNIKNKKKGNKIETLKMDPSGREKPLLVKEKKLFDFLSQQKFAQEFKRLNTGDTASWIKNRFKEKGGDISLKAAQELSSLVGSELWQAENEIDKLINYKKGSLPQLTDDQEKVNIEIEEVQLLVKGSFDENIFALTDAISARNRSLALKLLEEQYEAGLTDSYLISMVIRQTGILLSIRQALDSGMSSRQIISELKLHPFVIQKGIGQVRNFSLETLKRMLAKLVEIDKDMKTGKGDARTLLNVLLSKI